MAAQAAKGLKRYYRRKRHIDKIKQSKGCEECGYSAHAAALDFDHIDPTTKEFLIPRHLGGGNLKKLFKEIRKCRIVCANCHRVHSNKQWHSGVTLKVRGPIGIPIEAGQSIQVSIVGDDLPKQIYAPGGRDLGRAV